MITAELETAEQTQHLHAMTKYTNVFLSKDLATYFQFSSILAIMGNVGDSYIETCSIPNGHSISYLASHGR